MVEVLVFILEDHSKFNQGRGIDLASVSVGNFYVCNESHSDGHSLA
jgi:hypothetical protein